MRITTDFLVSSDTANGAANVSTDGSSFTVQLDDSFDIPKNAKNVQVAVMDGEIWYNTPNIETGVNDDMKVVSDGTGATPATVGTYNITIPEGLYTHTALNTAIGIQLQAAGAPEADLLTLGVNYSTQKTYLLTQYTGVSVDFTIATNFRVILGFDAGVEGPSTSSPEYFDGQNVAAFNQINYYLIHGDITDQGIRINNIYSNTLARVLIDTTPGKQVLYQPINPPTSSAQQLAGSKRLRYNYWLTDENNNLVNTLGEYWSARIALSYDI
jgi:hypothetical protein